MSHSLKRPIIKNKLEIESLQEKSASSISVFRRSLNLPVELPFCIFQKKESMLERMSLIKSGRMSAKTNLVWLPETNV